MWETIAALGSTFLTGMFGLMLARTTRHTERDKATHEAAQRDLVAVRQAYTEYAEAQQLAYLAIDASMEEVSYTGTTSPQSLTRIDAANEALKLGYSARYRLGAVTSAEIDALAGAHNMAMFKTASAAALNSPTYSACVLAHEATWRSLVEAVRPYLATSRADQVRTKDKIK